MASSRHPGADLWARYGVARVGDDGDEESDEDSSSSAISESDRDPVWDADDSEEEVLALAASQPVDTHTAILAWDLYHSRQMSNTMTAQDRTALLGATTEARKRLLTMRPGAAGGGEGVDDEAVDTATLEWGLRFAGGRVTSYDLALRRTLTDRRAAGADPIRIPFRIRRRGTLEHARPMADVQGRAWSMGDLVRRVAESETVLVGTDVAVMGTPRFGGDGPRWPEAMARSVAALMMSRKPRYLCLLDTEPLGPCGLFPSHLRTWRLGWTADPSRAIQWDVAAMRLGRAQGQLESTVVPGQPGLHIVVAVGGPRLDGPAARPRLTLSSRLYAVGVRVRFADPVSLSIRSLLTGVGLASAGPGRPPPAVAAQLVFADNGHIIAIDGAPGSGSLSHHHLGGRPCLDAPETCDPLWMALPPPEDDDASVDEDEDKDAEIPAPARPGDDADVDAVLSSMAQVSLDRGPGGAVDWGPDRVAASVAAAEAAMRGVVAQEGAGMGDADMDA